MGILICAVRRGSPMRQDRRGRDARQARAVANLGTQGLATVRCGELGRSLRASFGIGPAWENSRITTVAVSVHQYTACEDVFPMLQKR